MGASPALSMKMSTRCQWDGGRPTHRCNQDEQTPLTTKWPVAGHEVCAHHEAAKSAAAAGSAWWSNFWVRSRSGHDGTWPIRPRWARIRSHISPIPSTALTNLSPHRNVCLDVPNLYNMSILLIDPGPGRSYSVLTRVNFRRIMS